MRQILYPLMPNDETDAVTVTSQNLSAAGPYAQATQAHDPKAVAPWAGVPWGATQPSTGLRLRGLCVPSAAETAAAAVTVPGRPPRIPGPRQQETARRPSPESSYAVVRARWPT